MKRAAFVFSVLVSTYFLIWHHVSSVTKIDTVFTATVSISAIMAWGMLLGVSIISVWLVGDSEPWSMRRLIVTCFFAAIPSSLFVAQPSAAIPFSFIYFFGYPILIAVLVILFGQGAQLRSYSASKIETGLREIGFENIDQPLLTRCLVYVFFVVLVGVGHHMLSRVG